MPELPAENSENDNSKQAVPTESKGPDGARKPVSASWITLWVAIVAAIAPLTTAIQGWYNAQSQRVLEQNKQVNELRQKYLDRVMSDTQGERVLTFLVQVEGDQKLKEWATSELEATKKRITSKEGLYQQTIKTVAGLATQKDVIDADSPNFKEFWRLYNDALLPVESPQVEGLMVAIGNELRSLLRSNAVPSDELKKLSFRLASTMKLELVNSSGILLQRALVLPDGTLQISGPVRINGSLVTNDLIAGNPLGEHVAMDANSFELKNKDGKTVVEAVIRNGLGTWNVIDK